MKGLLTGITDTILRDESFIALVGISFGTKIKSVCTVPSTLRISDIDGVTFEVRSPLAVNFYIHLKDNVCTIGVITLELSHTPAHEVGRMVFTVKRLVLL
jgi:hypothetical protein